MCKHCILGIAVNDASLYLIYPVLTWFCVWHNHIFRCSTGWTTMGSLTLTQFTFNMIINKLMCKQITLMWRTMRLIQGTTHSFSFSLVLSLFISIRAYFAWHINLFTLFIVLLLFFLLNTHKTVKITIASTVLNMKLSQSPYFYCHKCLHFFFSLQKRCSHIHLHFVVDFQWRIDDSFCCYCCCCFLFLTSAFRKKLTRTNQIIERILKTI